MFDITILPLFLLAGREHSELPGLLVAVAPRKAVRLRAQDQLMLFMSLSNFGPSKEPFYSPAQQQEMLTRLSETYFTTSGSVTAGLRAVVTRLNDFLLNRNLRAPSEGQVTGTLNLAVLHGSTLLLAHAGATQSMVLGKTQVQQFDDRGAGRGLGLSKQLVPRFYQTTLESGNLLLVCAAPPDSWSTRALTGASQLSLDHLRRRLLGQAGIEITAAALKFQPGKGQIVRFRVGDERISADPADPEAQSSKTTAYKPVVSPTQTENAPASVPAEVLGESPDLTARVEQKGPGEFTASEPAAALYEENGETTSQALGSSLDERPSAGQYHVLPAAPVDPAVPADGDSGTLGEQPPVHADPLKAPASTAGRFARQAGPAHETQRPSQRSLTGSEAGAASRVRPGKTPAGDTHHQRSTRPGDTPGESAKARPRRPGGFSRQLGLGLKSIFRAGAGLRGKIDRSINPLINRVLPQRSEPLINLSPASMLFVAISVPLVVVAIATTVYFNAGRAEQFESYVNNARQYVERAAQQSENLQGQRESWTQALLWLEKAEQYGRSEAADQVREQAQGGMDGLDNIVRVAYRAAVPESFAVEVNITRMVATLNDVYLLDSNAGRVLRIYRVGNNYAVDPAFVCGPGQAAGQIIGPLIDLAVLPPNNSYRATVMATDVSGNLVYCSPGQSGYDSMMMPAPETNWGNIKAIDVADGLIYVLDPLVNAVWYIYGSNESIFNSEPRLFFSNQVPQMNDVIDMAIDKGFLYLLHSNGRMTTCEASGFELSPTRCNDPAPYGDARSGRDPAPLFFADARFVQMQTTQPPDPSLFILDDSQASVYHFSLRRMNLQRQYRPVYEPDYPLPSQPTAFVVTPNRRVLLAFRNQVFYAPLP